MVPCSGYGGNFQNANQCIITCLNLQPTSSNSLFICLWNLAFSQDATEFSISSKEIAVMSPLKLSFVALLF